MRLPRSARGLVVLGAVVIVGAVCVGIAGAVVMSTVLADTNVVRERIFRTDFTPSADQPRLNVGWHSHPGVAIVQVQQGRLDIAQGCRKHRLGPGDTYIEVPFLPVNAEASGPVQWTSTLILADSAPGTPDRLPASEPVCTRGNDQRQDGGDH
jgi:hypothetical protein